MYSATGTSTGEPTAAPGLTRSRDAEGHDARTRDLVLRAVVERGPVTAALLADELGLTATAVRRHLDALEGTGRIRRAPAPETRKGPGRPARAYVAGDARPLEAAGFATAYDDVATEALRFLMEQAGPDAVAEFARRRVAGLEERYGAVVAAAGDDVSARARALAGALAQDGFAATARPVGPMLPLTPVARPASAGLDRPALAAPTADAAADGCEPQHAHVSTRGVQLCQGHCPVQQVAAEFPQFCEAETEAFARLLGVHVQRLATLARGGHACTTYVPGVGAEPARTARPPTAAAADPPGPSTTPRTLPPTDPHHPHERTAR